MKQEGELAMLRRDKLQREEMELSQLSIERDEPIKTPGFLSFPCYI